MDGSRFDQLARTLVGSRRKALKGLVGFLVSGLEELSSQVDRQLGEQIMCPMFAWVTTVISLFVHMDSFWGY